jgi:hypothetical protein
MASFAQLSDMDAVAQAGSASDLSGWIRKLGRQIATCASTCADYTAAAGAYEQMRGLSDAELQRRGLSRATLARDLCAACDRSV